MLEAKQGLETMVSKTLAERWQLRFLGSWKHPELGCKTLNLLLVHGQNPALLGGQVRAITVGVVDPFLPSGRRERA